MKKTIGLAAVAVLLLAGCGAQTDTAETSPAAATSSPAPEPSPTPTETGPTIEQYASVIAKYETEWREVIDGAGDCRFRWTMGNMDDPTESAEAKICYAQESTMALRASTAVDELDALGEVPASIADLVYDTRNALLKVVLARMDEQCGTMGDEADTDDCTTAAGNAMRAYDAVEDELNAWGPYL
ncbi:hypothetical protein [Tessaracoccus palaemonis]|uniref:Lipoprotein n=1 Tax=Tessaracoccus palaemonis TaxID=2829499 RepID=A0ABX8SH62_9ACTN|nr:hypothetical protein [Tessaracoccus palaemonis]QXT62716.1 hypothetical protein KDB89_13435 [Tessaracoccus palaemonis]